MEMQRIFDAIQTSYFFNGVPGKVIEEIAGSTRLKIVEKDEVIFFEGDVCEGLYILQSGTVKLFRQAPNGRELILKVLDTGASFNEVPVFDGGTNPVNATALEHCEIWVVDAQSIRRALVSYPEIALSILAKLATNLRTLVQMAEELAFFQVTHRMARLLCQLLAEPTGRTETLRLTQDELAARLGTVREVAARALRELERSGAISMTHRQIGIRDRTRLEEWAQGPYG